MCEVCKSKVAMKKQGLISKPISHSCLQVDLINIQTQANKENKFIIFYQDSLTKSVVLHASQTKWQQNLIIIQTTYI
jgi:hypothetical protein